MNANVRWMLRNLVVLAVVAVPLIALFTAISTTIAGHDGMTLEPRRFLGDLAVLYPMLAIPLLVGGVVQSAVTLMAVRRVGQNRLLVALVAPLAFVPFLLFKTVDAGALYLAVPIALTCILYAAFVARSPLPLEADVR